MKGGRDYQSISALCLSLFVQPRIPVVTHEVVFRGTLCRKPWNSCLLLLIVFPGKKRLNQQ